MIVKCHKSDLDYFRRKARSTPNEIMALLLGSATRQAVVIEMFLYPPLTVSTPTAVDVCSQDTQEAEDEALAQGLRIVGDIHSHPNYAPVMSEGDFKNHRELGNEVSGIVEVTNRRTRVCFWQDGSPLPCTFEYLKDT